MEEIQYMLSQYSPVEIILLILFILVGTKTISTIFEWFYHKIEGYFSQKKDEEEQIIELETEHEIFTSQFDNISKTLNNIQEDIKLLTERMQENTKMYIVDKFHYFYHRAKMIDEASLQSLELRYMYYKSAGGDSYIDDLMNKLRSLPRVNIETIQQLKGVSNDTES